MHGCGRRTCQEEEREQIDEGERQLTILAAGAPNLLPPDREVVLSLGQRRAGSRLLEDDYVKKD